MPAIVAIIRMINAVVEIWYNGLSVNPLNISLELYITVKTEFKTNEKAHRTISEVLLDLRSFWNPYTLRIHASTSTYMFSTIAV
jgi:predicted membrane protein